MQEVRRNHIGTERGVLFLEYYGDNVVADVSFPLQLLRIVVRVWEQRRHVEHNLSFLKHLVDCRVAGVSVLDVQTAPVAFVVFELDPLPQQTQKVVEGGGRDVVTEQLFFCSLSELLIEDAELEGGD